MYTATVRITAKEGSLYRFIYITGFNPWFATPADNSVLDKEGCISCSSPLTAGSLCLVDAASVLDPRFGKVTRISNLRSI